MKIAALPDAVHPLGSLICQETFQVKFSFTFVLFLLAYLPGDLSGDKSQSQISPRLWLRTKARRRCFSAIDHNGVRYKWSKTDFFLILLMRKSELRNLGLFGFFLGHFFVMRTRRGSVKCAGTMGLKQKFQKTLIQLLQTRMEGEIIPDAYIEELIKINT